MKIKILGLLMGVAVVLSLLSCDQKPTDTTEQILDKVNDALDRRPDEKTRDAIEDMNDAIKDAAEEIQAGIDDITQEVRSQNKDAD